MTALRTALRRLRHLPLLLAISACSDAPTAVPPPNAVELAAPWSVATPGGAVGAELFVAGELAGRIDRMRSLVVVHEGRIAFERYFEGWSMDTLADVRSVTKSVVSALVGIAIDEGHIEGLDQPITDFLRRPRYPVRSLHESVTVGHLLTMSGGFEWTESGSIGYLEWIGSGDHVGYLLDRELQAEPGTEFNYNSAAVHLLGVVLEEATGTSLPSYADRVLFGPLGIGRRVWEELPRGYNGGAGLDLRPRDLARFGQLLLQEGWSGQRSVLPASWVGQATAPTLPPFPSSGPIERFSYGFLWWLDVERNAFLAWGYGGQFVYVAPELDLVVVATTEWRGVSGDIGPRRLQEEVLGIIVHRIVPAFE